MQNSSSEPTIPIRIPTAGKGTGTGLLILHLGTLLALIPSTFTWSGVAVAIVLCNLTGGVGLSLGYHLASTRDVAGMAPAPVARVTLWLTATMEACSGGRGAINVLKALVILAVLTSAIGVVLLRMLRPSGPTT